MLTNTNSIFGEGTSFCNGVSFFEKLIDRYPGGTWACGFGCHYGGKGVLLVYGWNVFKERDA